jgi:phospholipase/lecithinase/hemolysin
LTTTYNESYIQTYNLAYGGATVDSNLVKPYIDTVLSLRNQVEDEFVPVYGSHPSFAPWKSNDSLFAFWIGINDVGNSWWLNYPALYDQIFLVYDSLLEKLYATGARNFLYLTVPPVEKSPLTVGNGEYAVENEGLVIKDWNKRVHALAAAFKAKHEDAVTFVHDTYAVYDKVIADPKAFPQTSGLKNTTGYCKEYEK